MSRRMPSDEAILQAWRDSAVPWTAAVREGRIQSRVSVTNRAVVDAVISRSPQTVLDLGCGEGWLARALAARGIRVTGVDAVPALVAQARAAGGGEFYVLSYEELASGGFRGSADVVVSNFSLLGRQTVEALFLRVPRLLRSGGSFIVQTLHPRESCGNCAYRDGWREGSWAGIEGDFGAPAPWYFRTLESWLKLFDRSGMRVFEVREPPSPITGRPASVMFLAEERGNPADITPDPSCLTK